MLDGFFVFQPDKEACWICGSTQNRTHEHKYKASDLRRIFGTESMLVTSNGRVRLAQGHSSKFLKFESHICEQCNTKTTQLADRAYDRLIAALLQHCSDDDTTQINLEKTLRCEPTWCLPT